MILLIGIKKFKHKKADNSNNIEYAKKVLKFRSSTYLPHDVSYAMFKKYEFCEFYLSLILWDV